MALILHPATGFPVGDPDRCPLEEDSLPSAADIRKALSPLILSASGWRKVFASPEPGDPRAPWAAPTAGAAGAGPGPLDEDSLSARVSPADLVLAGAAAMAFYDRLRERSGRADPAVILGIDTRPTGPALADAMARVLLGLGARPRYLFIVAAPEIMAYAKACASKAADDEERAEGFAYVSASHNPPAHNGLKFGFGGGVLAWNLGHQHFAPAHRDGEYMSVHVTLNGIRGLLAPVCAWWLVSLFKGFGYGTSWVFAVCFAVNMIGALGFVRMARNLRRAAAPA